MKLVARMTGTLCPKVNPKKRLIYFRKMTNDNTKEIVKNPGCMFN